MGLAKPDPHRHAKLLVEERLLGRQFLPFQELLETLLAIADYAHRRLSADRKVSLLLDGEDDMWRIKELGDAELGNALHRLDLQLAKCRDVAAPWLQGLRGFFDPDRVRVGTLRRSTAAEGLIDLAAWVSRRAGQELRAGPVGRQGARNLAALGQQLQFLPAEPWMVIDALWVEKRTLSFRTSAGHEARVDAGPEWSSLSKQMKEVLEVLRDAATRLSEQQMWYELTGRGSRPSGPFRANLQRLQVSVAI
jgi:hypothetical protein